MHDTLGAMLFCRCVPDSQQSPVAIAITVSGVLVVFACIAAVWMRNSLPLLVRSWAQRRGPPELGKPLTLVLTDVEGSTELWEWNHQVGWVQPQPLSSTWALKVPSHWGAQVP